MHKKSYTCTYTITLLPSSARSFQPEQTTKYASLVLDR